MPPKNKPAKSAPAKAAAAPAATEPAEDVTAEATTEAATDADGAAEESAPLNRAERRARGKGTGQPQPTSRGKVVGGKGPASSQRMWANRRSG